MDYTISTRVTVHPSEVFALEKALPGMPFSLLFATGVAENFLNSEQTAVARAAMHKRPVLPWSAMERCDVRLQWAMTPEENLHMDDGFRTIYKARALRLPTTLCTLYYPNDGDAKVWYQARLSIHTESMWLRYVGEWVAKHFLELKQPRVLESCEDDRARYGGPLCPAFARAFLAYFRYVREEPMERTFGDHFKEHELQLLMVIEKYRAWYKQWVKDGQPVIAGKWVKSVNGRPIIVNPKTYTRSDDEQYLKELHSNIER